MIVAIETFTRESTEDNFISENLTKLIYNNWLLIAETDANGSVTREYSYSDDANGDAGVGKLIKFTDYTDKTGGLLSAESKNYFVLNDNVGNITSVIDREGNIINSYAYSPFGELIVEQEEVKLNIGFNTKYEDASGLIYYNNRYYDSELGRFISQDPIFEEGGVNLYNFVENDPINHWDILGFFSGGGGAYFATYSETGGSLTNYDIDFVFSFTIFGNNISFFLGTNDFNISYSVQSGIVASLGFGIRISDNDKNGIVDSVGVSAGIPGTSPFSVGATSDSLTILLGPSIGVNVNASYEVGNTDVDGFVIGSNNNIESLSEQSVLNLETQFESSSVVVTVLNL